MESPFECGKFVFAFCKAKKPITRAKKEVMPSTKNGMINPSGPNIIPKIEDTTCPKLLAVRNHAIFVLSDGPLSSLTKALDEGLKRDEPNWAQIAKNVIKILERKNGKRVKPKNPKKYEARIIAL